MHPASFLAQRLRRDDALKELPHVEVDKMGVVAIIDISGYTRLTNHLASLGSTDRMREIINPPFEMIISKVHQRRGSIIKLAGDSAIATWTLLNHEAPQELVQNAVLSCMELLESFKENHSAYHFSSMLETQSFASSSSGKPFISSHAENETLALHIGIGIGEVHHVFLGSLESHRDGTGSHRAEYFLAGKALLEAGAALNRAKPGQIVLSKEKALEAFNGTLMDERRQIPILKDDGSQTQIILDVHNRPFQQLLTSLASAIKDISRDNRDEEEGIISSPIQIRTTLFAFME
ncbi:hypothetical protein HDU67_004381, partial [Dinochytrium kinnereticum]